MAFVAPFPLPDNEISILSHSNGGREAIALIADTHDGDDVIYLDTINIDLAQSATALAPGFATLNLMLRD